MRVVGRMLILIERVPGLRRRTGTWVTAPPLAAACSAAVMGTSEAPKSTCPALNAAMPALLPTAE